MYTVLRFRELSEADIQSLGHEMESVFPGAFDGPDRGCPNRVSISLADEDEWELHVDSITEKISMLSKVIATMRKLGRVLELDVAIEPDDYRSLLSELVFGIDFQSLLLSQGITLTVSIYGTQQVQKG